MKGWGLECTFRLGWAWPLRTLRSSPPWGFEGCSQGGMSAGMCSPEPSQLSVQRGGIKAPSLLHPRHCWGRGGALLGEQPFSQHQGPGNPWLLGILRCQPRRPRDPAKMNE